MGTIAVSSICDQVSNRLFDETKVRWTPTELVGYYNEVVNLFVSYKPSSFVTTAIFNTVSGAKQTLPAGANFLLKATRNVTSGKPIRQIQKAVLDHMPGISWYSKSGSDVQHFVYDKQNPKVFWIYPQPPAGSQIELEYAAVPEQATENAGVISGTLSIDDTDVPFIILGMLACAMQKNSLSGDITRANWYASQFASHLGIKTQSQFTFAPMTREPNAEDS